MHSLNFKQFQEKAIAISALIATYFDKNFLISLKNEYYQGYEFTDHKRFIFERRHESFLQSRPYITIRFFCGLKSICKSKHPNYFFRKIEQYDKSPIFFMVPYFYQGSCLTEKCASYGIKCEFKLVYDLQKQCIKLSSKNFLNYSKFDILKRHIKKVLLHQQMINQSCDISRVIKPNFVFKNLSQQKSLIIDSIKKIITHMKQGECYLANMTYNSKLSDKNDRFNAETFLHKWFLTQPTFGYFLQQKDVCLESYSPERFLIKQGNKVCTQPIKGTASTQTRTALWSNVKEIQEHTMVVDLLRHDLNHICKAGSVKVQKPFYLKKCHSIIQMQSSIVGSLKTKMGISSLFKSILPAGSVTGTPKKRTCTLIEKYELTPRGYYTGVAGILETDKNFDTTVLIRSIYKGKLGIYTGSGAGITTLSKPEEEYKEFCLKLKTFL